MKFDRIKQDNLFIKRVQKSNMYDVFCSPEGWELWSRVHIKGNDVAVIKGEALKKSLRVLVGNLIRSNQE